MTTRSEREHHDEVVAGALQALRTPTPSEDFFVELRLALEEVAPRHALPPRRWIGVRRLERRPRPVRIALLAVVAAVGAGAGVLGAALAGALDSAEKVSTRSPVISFEPAQGWNTIETVAGESGVRVAWAANVPFRPEESFGFPNNTVRNLPPNGIVIVTTEPRLYEGDATFPKRELPLTLSDGYFHSDQYEGQPAPNVSMFNIDAVIDDRLLNILVWMGRNQPTEEMTRQANEELARLRVPPR